MTPTQRLGVRVHCNIQNFACVTTQVEEATVPSSKSDEKAQRQSARTRSSKSKQAVKNKELVELQENGDVTEDQLQVHTIILVLSLSFWL